MGNIVVGAGTLATSITPLTRPLAALPAVRLCQPPCQVFIHPAYRANDLLYHTRAPMGPCAHLPHLPCVLLSVSK